MSAEQEPLFRWAREHHARSTDPITSFIAQEMLKGNKVQAMMRLCLLVHAANLGGLTDEEVFDQIQILWPGTFIHDRNHSKRCSDLEREAYLADSGLMRINKTKRPAKIRRITKEGVDGLLSPSKLKVPKQPKKVQVKTKRVIVEGFE